MMAPFGQLVISPELVGRFDELHSLHHLIDLSKTGEGRVILLSGDPGIGKSRLVLETKSYAGVQGFQLFQASCVQADSAFPYAPFSDLLQASLREALTTYQLNELSPLMQELCLLLPEIIPLPTRPVPLSIDPEEKRQRLFAVLADFFMRGTSQHPVMLVVEDIHWSDEGSLEFLDYLSRHATRNAFVLLLTYRSDEIGVMLRHLLAQFDHQRVAHDIDLKPLLRDEVDSMLRAIFRQDRLFRSDFLDRLYGLTEGNPFFIEEVLKSMVSAGEIYFVNGAWGRKSTEELHIPRSVQDAVYQRSEHLNKTAREVIHLAAVMGREFNFDLLQHLTRYSDTRLLALMKELIAAQLIVEESAERFVFRHALTRQAFYNQLLTRERKRLHLSIGEAIEALYATSGERYIADLAYHFFESDTWEKTLAYSMQAGEKAWSLYALRPAVAHFTRAFKAAQQLARTPPPTLYRLRGLSYEMLGELTLARADLEALLQNALLAEDRQEEWQALLDIGALWAGRDYIQTGQYYQRAFELARQLNIPQMLAKSLNRLGNWHLNVERPLEAHWHHQEAFSLYQQLGDQSGVAETLDLLGAASCLGGNLVQGTLYCKDAIERFQALAHREGEIFCRATLALAAPSYQTDTMVAGIASLMEAAQDSEVALKLSREIGHRSGETLAMILLGINQGSQGQYRRAFTLLQAALANAEDMDHLQWQTFANFGLGALYCEILTAGPAEAHLSKAMALAREINSAHWLRTTAGFLTLCYVGQGHLEQAHELLESVLDPPTAVRTLGQRLLWRARAELALAQGEGTLAMQAIEQLLASAVNYSSAVPIPRLSKLRADALLMLGRDDDAELELEKAQMGATNHGALPLLWRIQVSFANLHEKQARHHDALLHAQSALSIIDECADQLPETLSESFVRRAHDLLPASCQKAESSPVDGLTAREREVVVLLALGKTNRQIAKHLVISERTIETHVRNILSKLDLNSRTQVALWAVESGLIDPRD